MKRISKSESETDWGFPLTGREFEDQLLLAIIDAYPVNNPKAQYTPLERRSLREQRLSCAKKALFGDQARLGPKRFDDE
jgi:hypothetical protein